MQHVLWKHFPLFKFLVILLQQTLFCILLHFLLLTKQLWNILVLDLNLLVQHNWCLHLEFTDFHEHFLFVIVGQCLFNEDLHVLKTCFPSLSLILQQYLLVHPFLCKNLHVLFTFNLHCLCPTLHWWLTLFLFKNFVEQHFLAKQSFLCLLNLQNTFEESASFLHLLNVLQVHHLLLNDLFGPFEYLQHLFQCTMTMFVYFANSFKCFFAFFWSYIASFS